MTFDVNPDYVRVKYSLRSNSEGLLICDATVTIMQNSTGADMFVRINIGKIVYYLFIYVYVWSIRMCSCDTQIQQIVFMEDRTGKLESLISGKRWNVCTYFRKPQLDPFMKLTFDAMNTNGNKLNSCPILQVLTLQF